jgi:ribosomal protein L31
MQSTKKTSTISNSACIMLRVALRPSASSIRSTPIDMQALAGLVLYLDVWSDCHPLQVLSTLTIWVKKTLSAKDTRTQSKTSCIHSLQTTATTAITATTAATIIKHYRLSRLKFYPCSGHSIVFQSDQSPWQEVGG